MKTSRALTLCVVGAEPRTSARIHALLTDQRTQLDSIWHPAHYAEADILLIDADSVHGHMDWLRARSLGRRIVTLGTKADVEDPARHLHLPVDATELVTLLNRIGHELEANHPAPLRSTDASIANARQRIALARAQAKSTAIASAATEAATTPERPAAARTLLDLLVSGSPVAQRLRLQADGLPELILDPREQTWYSTSSLKGLSGWATRAITDDDVKPIHDGDFAIATSTLEAEPWSRLQWLTHLLRGDGRLAAALNPNGLYRLSRWPQAEREFPKHFRIATVMLKSAASITQIAEQADATPGEVANFINAYHALGYVSREVGDVAPREDAHRGLFGLSKKTAMAS